MTDEGLSGLLQDCHVVVEREQIPVDVVAFGDWFGIVFDGDRIGDGEAAAGDLGNALASRACDRSMKVSLVHVFVPVPGGKGNDHRTATREVIW